MIRVDQCDGPAAAVAAFDFHMNQKNRRDFCTQAFIRNKRKSCLHCGEPPMKPPARLRLIAAWLVLGTGVRAQGAQIEASLALENLAERTIAREESAAARAAEKIPPHEAIVTPPKDRTPEYADKVPPPKIAERPGEAAPNPNALWIQGYWDWDSTRKEFVWVTGTWRVPLPGKFWVDGFWRHRDEKGWERVPGFWSERRATPTAVSGAGATRDWREVGAAPRAALGDRRHGPRPRFLLHPGRIHSPGRRGRLEARLLVSFPAGMGMVSGALGPPSERLGFPRRFLEPRRETSQFPARKRVRPP